MVSQYFQIVLNPITEGDITRACEVASRYTVAHSPELGRGLSPSGINAADILLRMYRAHDPTEEELAVEQGARILVDLAADARASVTTQVTQAAAVAAVAAAASSSSSSPLSSPPSSPDLQIDRRFANRRVLRMIARFLLESVGINVECESDDSDDAGGVEIAANEGTSEDSDEDDEVIDVDETQTEVSHEEEEVDEAGDNQPQRQQRASVRRSSSCEDADSEDDKGVLIKEEDEDVNMEDIPATEDEIAGSPGTEMNGLEWGSVSQREEVVEDNLNCGGTPIASIEWDDPQIRQEMMARLERIGREYPACLRDETDDETDGAYDADLSDFDDDYAGNAGGPLIFFPAAASRAARELRHVTASSAITSLISPGRRMWGPNGVSYIYHTVNSGNYRTGGANFTIHEDPSSATNHGPSSSASERTNFFRVERNFLQENVSTPALSLEEERQYANVESPAAQTLLAM